MVAWHEVPGKVRNAVPSRRDGMIGGRMRGSGLCHRSQFTF